MPYDELEKLRLTLLHAYDKRKPLIRRLIEAMKRTRPQKNPFEGAQIRNRDAA
jgi:hypothetical protein